MGFREKKSRNMTIYGRGRLMNRRGFSTWYTRPPLKFLNVYFSTSLKGCFEKKKTYKTILSMVMILVAITQMTTIFDFF